MPRYGSPEWQALPDESRAKAAACIVAAESWRTYWLPDEHARRLHTEIDAARAQDDDGDARWSPEIVAEVHGTANRPTFAELCDRRGEPGATRAARIATAGQRRPGD